MARVEVQLSTRRFVLVATVEAAYLVARREVFDAEPLGPAALTPRQRQVLVDLEVAEDELRRFRAREAAELSADCA